MEAREIVWGRPPPQALTISQHVLNYLPGCLLLSVIFAFHLAGVIRAGWKGGIFAPNRAYTRWLLQMGSACWEPAYRGARAGPFKLRFFTQFVNRLLMPAFLHANLIHLGLNSLALFSLLTHRPEQ
eukprot:g20002.t1